MLTGIGRDTESCFDYERRCVIRMRDTSARSTRVDVLAALGAKTPGEFIAKWWWASELKDRSASQSHFIDPCRLHGKPTPTDTDPTGDRYCFDRDA